MCRILALDLAGRTGWALWAPSFDVPIYGTAKLPTGRPGQTYAAFRDWLLQRVIGDEVEHLVVESIFVSEKTITAAPRLYGLLGIAHEVAFRRGISINSEVTVTEWRKHFLGQAAAPRTITDKAKRREWLKQRAKDECERRGWPVKHDDESDALGLLVFERARLLPRYGASGELFGYEPAPT